MYLGKTLEIQPGNNWNTGNNLEMLFPVPGYPGTGNSISKVFPGSGFFQGAISRVCSSSWVEAIEISCSCPGFPVFQVFGEHLYSQVDFEQFELDILESLFPSYEMDLAELDFDNDYGLIMKIFQLKQK